MPGQAKHSSLSGWIGIQTEPEASTKSIQRVLNAIRRHLNMDVAFVSEFREHDRIFHFVDADDRSPIRPGDTAPLASGYCQRVIDGRLPQLIRDSHRLPATKLLPETSQLPIGAHLSVPIYLRDGRVYGTFCCFSFAPDESLTARDLQVMKAFAELVADQLEQDAEVTKNRFERVKYLTETMRKGQPSMVYQPIYDLATGQSVGIEALSRFEALPLRSPDVWYAEAAALGLGPDLEACAARQALTALTSQPRDSYVAINASPEFVASGVFETVLSGVDVSRVVLEITEHASVAEYAPLLDAMIPLRAAGLRVAIDDTGAGYASMRHILKIEPDIVKLDISLTRGIDSDRKRRALASALIAFAAETGIEIIAEGVETALELKTLQALGVVYGQGYYLARPALLEEVLRLDGIHKDRLFRQASLAADPDSGNSHSVPRTG
jgi:EAL domain-containing protein (putative c-di-GMP-specific phosphodiesterase class I)